MNDPDPYVDPTIGVLRNCLGIADSDELAHAEADLTSLRLTELRRTRLPGRYDLAHLQAFHRYIFGDVYPWAGEIRTVTISKGAPFCLPQHIQGAATDVFAGLAVREHLLGLDRSRFLDGLAELFGDLNALHPFREGNGRTQRAFLTQLARDAGYEPRWSGMDRSTHVNVSRAAHNGDLTPLRHMLEHITTAVPAAPHPREPR